MAKTTMSVTVDADIRNKAEDIFKELGLSMSGAVNIFLNMCVKRDGLPFEVNIHSTQKKTTGKNKEEEL